VFYPYDPFSEIVVHFLGYFQIAVQDMRLRLDLQQIQREDPVAPDGPQLEQLSTELQQFYSLAAFLPGVHYAPPDWIIRGDAPVEAVGVNLRLPPVSIEFSGTTGSLREYVHSAEAEPLPYAGPHPGALMAVISQTIVLNDDDIFSMEGVDGPVHFNSGASYAIPFMHAAATDLLGPLAAEMGLHNYTDVGRLIDTVKDALVELDASPDVELQLVDNLDGYYVDGPSVDEAPRLDDFLPEHLREPASAHSQIEVNAEGVAHVEIVGSNTGGSVTYNSGGNHLVNDAAVLNAGLVATHYVVAGDLHQLDAIMQINVYADHDTIADNFPVPFAPNATTAINLAGFTQETRDASAAAKADPGVMPSNWQVTVVTGDIIFIEWMKQLTLMSDQDIGVLTATGSNVTVTSGENLASNHISIQNIGLYYDLILVGGNVYDVNIIVQTNVLYDNDTISFLGGGSAGSPSGLLNTGDNLLWNQATISNVGAVEVEDVVSDHYSAAMRGLSAGDYSMPEGFQNDAALEGIAVPRVLYVSGSIYDLRYIEQTTILSDADLVVVAESKLDREISDTSWALDTGSNALINTAVIKDYDSFGDHIQVGRNHYSDAILIQAEILAADGSGQPDALVSEVVAFLDTNDDLAIAPAYDLTDGLHHDVPTDVMQSVLA
jgi:hypothetical protein